MTQIFEKNNIHAIDHGLEDERYTKLVVITTHATAQLHFGKSLYLSLHRETKLTGNSLMTKSSTFKIPTFIKISVKWPFKIAENSQ